MNFDFLKPDSTLVPCQAHMCGWKGLSNICSALLTSFYERPIFTQAVGENRSDNWDLKLTDTPLTKEELTALLEALHADDYDWDANNCGEYPIWELSQGVATKLVAMALPFSVEASHAADDGVWFTGNVPEEMLHSVYVVTVVRYRIEGLNTEIYYSRYLIDSQQLPAPTEQACEDYLRKIAGDFLNTEEGKCAYEDTCEDFNWGDMETYIPDDFFSVYGVVHDTSRPGAKQFQCCGEFIILVNQDEQLGNGHFDD